MKKIEKLEKVNNDKVTLTGKWKNINFWFQGDFSNNYNWDLNTGQVKYLNGWNKSGCQIFSIHGTGIQMRNNVNKANIWIPDKKYQHFEWHLNTGHTKFMLWIHLYIFAPKLFYFFVFYVQIISFNSIFVLGKLSQI